MRSAQTARLIVTRLRPPVDALLGRVDLALVRRSAYDNWLKLEEPSYLTSALPASAEEGLRADHPRLRELRRRYSGHPAAAHTLWAEDLIQDQVRLPYFRGDNAYLWQRRRKMLGVNYALTAFYLRQHDPLGLLDLLIEDGVLGAQTYNVDGVVVSRDLLDSVTELTFLEEELGLSDLQQPTLLDIGAGYGRLAHRATAAFGNLTYLCTDGVPLSTFLCEFYLRFRGVSRSEVLPLDVVDHELRGRQIDVALNIHSFSECSAAVIGWWLDLLVRSNLKHLMVVPNGGDKLLSAEPDGSKRDFEPLIRERGFDLAVKRPKYVHSEAVQEHGLYPAHYFLYKRTE